MFVLLSFTSFSHSHLFFHIHIFFFHISSWVSPLVWDCNHIPKKYLFLCCFMVVDGIVPCLLCFVYVCVLYLYELLVSRVFIFLGREGATMGADTKHHCVLWRTVAQLGDAGITSDYNFYCTQEVFG